MTRKNTAKRKKGRIRQTPTSFQKAFDKHTDLLKPVSWSDRIPELLHISIALSENSYQTVKADYWQIANFINEKSNVSNGFAFGLTHTIKILNEREDLLVEINKTCFKNAFDQILIFYYKLLGINTYSFVKLNLPILLKGYRLILDGRSDTAILCKYLMLQYQFRQRPDPFNMFNLKTPEEILDPRNVSMTMANFLTSTGSRDSIDLDLCQDIWLFNYTFSPFIPKPDHSMKENSQFKEFEIDALLSEFTDLFSQFKRLNLLGIYNRIIAEINMGFAARICNLSIEAVEFVKTHRGELAELVFRSILENYIVASWLMKQRDFKLHKRFRDFSSGRDKMFGQAMSELTSDLKMKEIAKKIVNEASKAAGVPSIALASERGDIFDIRLDQMADEVWGSDNIYYWLYKRSSEVTHGHWKVIAKYHLAQSLNPMHNGLYRYNENPHRFASILPAFISLQISTEMLLLILNDINHMENKVLSNNMKKLHSKTRRLYMEWFKKHVLNAELNDE